jgi:hypothetical protein
MYTGFLHLHSVLRYMALLLLLIAIINSFVSWMKKSTYNSRDKKIGLLAMIGVHIQLLVGLALYFMSPYVRFSGFSEIMKDPHLRFWTVEHITLMFVAIALITIGRSSIKKITNPITKHKRIVIFYGLGLLLILAAIPWPFSAIARPWFSF